MAKGTYGAYKQLTPDTADFSKPLLEDERARFRYRQEQRLVDQNQERKRERIAKEGADALSSMDDVITGIDTLDEVGHMGMTKARDLMGDVYKQFSENPEARYNPESQLKIANLKKFPETLSQATAKSKKYYDTLLQGFADKSISTWDEELLKEFEAFWGVEDENGNISPNIMIDFDKKGNPYVHGLTKDGKRFTKSIIEMNSGAAMPTPTQAYDIEEYSKGIADGLGKAEEARVSGGFSMVAQDFSSHEQAVRERVRKTLGSAQNPTDLAKSMWADEANLNRSPEEFNEQSLQEIEDFMVNTIKSKYDKTVKSYSQLRDPNGSGDKEENPMENVQLMIDASSNKPIMQTINPNNEGEQNAYAFSLKTPVSTGVGDKSKKINVLYLTDRGDIVFKGQEEVDVRDVTGEVTGSTFEEVTGGGLNSEEMNVLANRLGFANSANLRRALEQKTSGLNTSSSNNNQQQNNSSNQNKYGI